MLLFNFKNLVFLVLSSCFVKLANAQKVYQPAKGSAERKEQMTVLHKEFDPKFHAQVIIFEVLDSNYLSNGSWAFMGVSVFQKNGNHVDFKKSDYKQAWEEEAMDSNGIFALLKKVNGKWRLLDHFDFPTDVPFGCWWKIHQAPKEIFPYTESVDNCSGL